MIETIGEDLLALARRNEMAITGEERLRALIRLIPPARALKEDLEKSIHLELYSGTGALAVRSFQGLQASVSTITDDPYVAALGLTVPDPECQWNEAKGGYDFGEVDWDEFYAVVRGEGPVAKERMTARREAWDLNAWVREAAAVHEAKRQGREAA